MNKLNIFCVVTLSSMFVAVYAYTGGAGVGMGPMYMNQFAYQKPMMSYGYSGYSAGLGGAGGAAQGIWQFLVFIIILIIIAGIFDFNGSFGKGGGSGY